jgi:hypothetical protein
MPYTYEASKKALELTVKFQKFSDRIPLPLLVILFRNLAQNIAGIFSAYGNDTKEVQSVLSGLIINESNLSDTGPAYQQAAFLQNLMKGHLNSFKLCAEGYEDIPGDAIAEGYAKTFGYITKRHISSTNADIISYNMPKGKSLKKLLMWSQVDPKEIEALRNKENIAEEKEQQNSDKKPLGFGQ